MTGTRARRAAAKRACSSQEHDQTLPSRKCQRRDTTRGKDRKQTIDSAHDPAAQPPAKPPQSPRPLTEERPDEAAERISTHPIAFWVREGRWPRGYFVADMEHALARKRYMPSLRRKRSDSGLSITTPSDRRPREEKAAPYTDSRYETLLNTKECYMQTSEQGILDESKQDCRDLIQKQQEAPGGTIFDDAVFEKACQNIQKENEARVIQDISRLLVPSAETHGLYAKRLAILKESVNAGWNNSIPLTGTRPQPDYSVGFRCEAFTSDQLAKLSPFVGDFIAGDLSFFMGTYYLWFPFLACEVKCGNAGLDIADRQNAQSMMMAARGIVELFRLVKREEKSTGRYSPSPSPTTTAQCESTATIQ